MKVKSVFWAIAVIRLNLNRILEDWRRRLLRYQFMKKIVGDFKRLIYGRLVVLWLN